MHTLSLCRVDPFPGLLCKPFFLTLRIINPQRVWNPQIAASCGSSLAVGDRRNDGFRSGIFVTPAVRPEIAEDGPIVRTHSP